MPILHLLDSLAFFEAYTGMVGYLSACGKTPPMFVVGIANTDQFRDLTPTHAIHWLDGEKEEKHFRCIQLGSADDWLRLC